MATFFADALHSKLFTFLIGKDEAPVVVHGGMIARLSAPLDRLVNGHMREAQENTAKFPELELCDFERVCEFAYRGEYTPPKTRQFQDTEVEVTTDIFLLADPLLPTTPIVEEHNRAYFDAPSPPSETSEPFPGDGRTHEENFWGVAHWFPEFGGLQRPWWPEHVRNGTWREDRAPVLLGHARLYAFAEQYMISQLKRTAFNKLHVALKRTTLFVSSLDAVNQLARFVYDNERIPDRDGKKVDPVRQLVVVYIVMHLQLFKDSPGHRQNMEAEGEFATDVMDYMAKWLLFDGGEVANNEEEEQGEADESGWGGGGW